MHHRAESSFGVVRSNAMQNIKAQFDKFNIDMPEPIYKIRIEDSSPVSPSDQPALPTEPDPGPVDTAHKDEKAKGDIRPDTTIQSMSTETARSQGDENLLSEDAPSE